MYISLYILYDSVELVLIRCRKGESAAAAYAAVAAAEVQILVLYVSRMLTYASYAAVAAAEVQILDTRRAFMKSVNKKIEP